MNMNEHLTVTLAQAREEEVAYKDHMATLSAEIAATELGQRFIQAQSEYHTKAQEVSMLEGQLRDFAIHAFINSDKQDKRLVPGVQVTVSESVTYNEGAAKAWCATNALALLALDKKKYEKAWVSGLLESAPGEPAAAINAQIDGDLSTFLLVAA